MFINLIERVHEASDIETHESYYVDRVLETHSDRNLKKKTLEKFRKLRLEGIAEGRDVKIVYTAKHPNDPRYGQNRKMRRWRDRLLRRLLKRTQKVTKEKQEQVDEEVNKFFGERRESGLVIPNAKAK